MFHSSLTNTTFEAELSDFLRYFLTNFCSELHLALLVGKVRFAVPYGEMHNSMRQGVFRAIVSLSNHIKALFRRGRYLCVTPKR